MEKKNIFIIAGVIIFVFASIAFAVLFLKQKEEKTNFTVSAINTQITTQDNQGLLVGYDNIAQRIKIEDSDIIPQDKGKITVPASKRSETGGYFLSNNYKISPDGRFLAVLTPADPTMLDRVDKNDFVSSILVYDLSSGAKHEFVKADNKTMITSFSWDWSGQAISFTATKRLNRADYYENPISFFMPPPSYSSKIYLHKVELATGKISTKEYPAKADYYYGGGTVLLSSNNDRYYLLDGSALITVSDKVTQENQERVYFEFEDDNIYFSNDYKTVVLNSTSQIIVYNLEKKEKQTFNIGTGNLHGVRVGIVTIAPDGSGIAFVKSSPSTKASSNQSSISYSSPYETDSSSKVTNETIWYYNFANKQFKELLTRAILTDSYSYNSKTNLAFSPDGKKLAAITSNYEKNQPIAKQTLRIFDLVNDRSNEYPINFTTAHARLIDWR